MYAGILCLHVLMEYSGTISWKIDTSAYLSKKRHKFIIFITLSIINEYNIILLLTNFQFIKHWIKIVKLPSYIRKVGSLRLEARTSVLNHG